MKHILLLLLVLLSLCSCSGNDYLVDGGVSDPHVNMSTYDYLKSNKHLDTLAILIDNAKMIDVVNAPSTTFFAPDNYTILKYIKAKRTATGNSTYGIKDITQAELVPLLGGYIFHETLDRSKLVKDGKIYIAHNGEERRLSLEPVSAYSNQLEKFPEYVYYTFKGGATWDPTNVPLVDDKKTVVRTSNLISTNGIIHVLQGSHTLGN